MTLDDPALLEQAVSDPVFFLDSIDEPCIIDESQLAPGILSYVKMRVDADRKVNGRFVFTGSQQFGVIRNLGDSLAGRVALLDLRPFSVGEMKDATPLNGGLELFSARTKTKIFFSSSRKAKILTAGIHRSISRIKI